MNSNPAFTAEETAGLTKLATRLKREVDEMSSALEKKKGMLDAVLSGLQASDDVQAPHSAAAAGRRPSKISPKKRPALPKGTAANIDHEKVAKDIALSLKPEFNTDDFLKECLRRYPDNQPEFSRALVKRRLRALVGFDDAPIAVITRGAGRKPTRYRVN